MDAGEYEKAVRCLNFALAINREHSGAWFLKGTGLAALERFDESLFALERCLKLDQKNPYAWQIKGLISSREQRHQDAIFSFKRALRYNRSDFQLWYMLGKEYIELKEYVKAIAALNQAVFLNASDADSWYYLAFALSVLGKNQEALLAYDQAIKADPGNIDLVCYKGFALCELGRFKEAEDLFRRVLEKDPEHILALVNLSERYLVRGELTEGISAAKKALRITDDDEFKIISRYLLISGYFLAGKDKKALSELDQLLEFRKRVSKTFKVTDWNFSPLVSVIKQKLSKKNKKLLLSLIKMLQGKIGFNKFLVLFNKSL